MNLLMQNTDKIAEPLSIPRESIDHLSSKDIVIAKAKTQRSRRSHSLKPLGRIITAKTDNDIK